MKSLFVVLFLSTSFAFASPWTVAAEKELASWNGSSFNALIPIYRQAFLGNLPHRITAQSSEVGTKPVTHQEVYVGDKVVSVRSISGGWNVFADGTNVYAWKEGETIGIVETENPVQIMDYLRGVLSPAELMSGSYVGHLEKPNNYKITDKIDTIEYSPIDSEPFSNFTFILQKKPLWLLGFRVKDPSSGKTIELKISYPEHVPEIPAIYTEPPSNVKFQRGQIPWQRDLIPYI